MELMPKSLRATVPALYSQEKEKDPIVRAKFFTPSAGATWFLLEMDADDDTCFGFAYLGPHLRDEAELGYFLLSELREFRGPFNLGVERDRHFKPKPLSEAKKELGL